MADLFQWWRQDLTIMPDGDLLMASGVSKTGEIIPEGASIEGEQRVIRRLMTTASQYIWHMAYGAGLPGYVGRPAEIQAIEAITISQMMLEDVVAPSPLPQVIASKILDGINLNISYIDNNVGKQVTVGFDLNA